MKEKKENQKASKKERLNQKTLDKKKSSGEFI